MWRPWAADEHGQTSAEWLGIMVVVAAIIAVLAASGIGTQVRDQAGDLVCDILNDDCATGGGQPVDTDGRLRCSDGRRLVRLRDHRRPRDYHGTSGRHAI